MPRGDHICETAEQAKVESADGTAARLKKWRPLPARMPHASRTRTAVPSASPSFTSQKIGCLACIRIPASGRLKIYEHGSKI